jgi:CRISPR-associated protein Cmr6
MNMSQRRKKSTKQRDKSSPKSKGQYPHKLPLPRETWQLFSQRDLKCENVGLLFDRYVRFIDPDWGTCNYTKKETVKQWNLKEFVRAQDQVNKSWQNSKAYYAIERWKEMVESQGAKSFNMKPEWRFVIGLGEKTALEAGFTFHRIYGFPIIPGSALKGLARMVALFEIAEILQISKLPLSGMKERKQAKNNKKSPLEKLDDLLMANDERIQDESQRKVADENEQKKLDTLRQEKGLTHLDIEPHRDLIKTFRRIFGTPYAGGEVIFFDAMPAEPPQLEVDVMTVHYRSYYEDKSNQKPPADNDNPNPIPFLTVGKTLFSFAVGRRGEKDKEAQQQAEDWLKYGLKELGVGVKTSAGYGYFE